MVNGGVRRMNALPNPFFDSALVPAVAAESVATLDLTDRLDVAAANFNPARSPLADDTALNLEITPVSVLGAVTSSELAGAEMERAVPVRSLGIRTQEKDPALIPFSDGVLRRSLPTAETALSVTTARAPSEFIPDPTSGSLPIPTEVGKLAAGATTLSAPAVFSDDARIHKIMLAVADEVADELRNINEAILFREFGNMAWSCSSLSLHRHSWSWAPISTPTPHHKRKQAKWASTKQGLDAGRLSKYGNPECPEFAPIDICIALDKCAGKSVILECWNELAKSETNIAEDVTHLAGEIAKESGELISTAIEAAAEHLNQRSESNRRTRRWFTGQGCRYQGGGKKEDGGAMTRDEAIALWERGTCKLRTPAEIIDDFVALGMLKLDKEPSPAELAHAALKQAGHSATLILDELDCIGLEIVKKK
jgi:hypothetical protein